jgi:hypothetical protein
MEETELVGSPRVVVPLETLQGSIGTDNPKPSPNGADSDHGSDTQHSVFQSSGKVECKCNFKWRE